MKTFPRCLAVLGMTIASYGVEVESEEEGVMRDRHYAPMLERAIVGAAEVQLLSIEPESRYAPKQEGTNFVTVDSMEGSWLITGEAKLTDRNLIADLARSLRRSIEEDREFGPPPCFLPRHAIRFERDTDVVTVLVCFECFQCYTHRFKERSYFQVSSSAEPLWTDIFTKAGLKVSK
jgi:hypothetical protein